MSTWKVEPASVPPSLPDAAEPQPEVEAPEASMTVSTVHATKRIPSALRAKSLEAVSATQVCMRVILSAAGSPDDFYDVSRPASPCVTRIGSGSGTDSDARALCSIAGGESSPAGLTSYTPDATVGRHRDMNKTPQRWPWWSQNPAGRLVRFPLLRSSLLRHARLLPSAAPARRSFPRLRHVGSFRHPRARPGGIRRTTPCRRADGLPRGRAGSTGDCAERRFPDHRSGRGLARRSGPRRSACDKSTAARGRLPQLGRSVVARRAKGRLGLEPRRPAATVRRRRGATRLSGAPPGGIQPARDAGRDHSGREIGPLPHRPGRGRKVVHLACEPRRVGRDGADVRRADAARRGARARPRSRYHLLQRASHGGSQLGGVRSSRRSAWTGTRSAPRFQAGCAHRREPRRKAWALSALSEPFGELPGPP